MNVTFAAASALLLARALVITGTDACPSRQRVYAEEHAHIDADLRDQSRGGHPIHTRDLYGRNAKLVFSAIQQVDAGDVGLYQGPEYPQLGRQSRKLSTIEAAAAPTRIDAHAPELGRIAVVTLDAEPTHDPSAHIG